MIFLNYIFLILAFYKIKYFI